MTIHQVEIPLSIFREGKVYIASSPVLDLSTCADTLPSAKARFVEAAEIFFKELAKMGTTEEVLGDLGWQRTANGWQPPEEVAHEKKQFDAPVAV